MFSTLSSHPRHPGTSTGLNHYSLTRPVPCASMQRGTRQS